MRPGTRDSVGDVRTRARANRALARITTAPTADEMRALMSRADGADRVVGFVQDVLMLAGGGPGACTNVALALNDARWPFRAYKPVENLLPLLRGAPQPHACPPPRTRRSTGEDVARRHPQVGDTNTWIFAPSRRPLRRVLDRLRSSRAPLGFEQVTPSTPRRPFAPSTACAPSATPLTPPPA